MLIHQARDLVAARVTLILAALLFVIHGVVEVCGGPEGISAWYLTFGLSREGLLQGQVWQLFTYGFLHGDWLHLGLNLLALLAVGARLERIGGPEMVLKTVAIGLLGGGVSHVALSGSDSQVLVGVSGAVFAGVLCLCGISPGSRMWPLPISGKNFGYGVLIASAVLASLNPRLRLGGWSDWGRQLDDLGGGVVFSTSHACHLGGALAGLIAAHWLLRPRVSLAQLQADRRRREGPCG